MDKKVKNHTSRTDIKFNEELVVLMDIIQKESHGKIKTSIRELTNLITKHNSWDQIKEDIINRKLRGDGNE